MEFFQKSFFSRFPVLPFVFFPYMKEYLLVRVFHTKSFNASILNLCYPIREKISATSLGKERILKLIFANDL